MFRHEDDYELTGQAEHDDHEAGCATEHQNAYALSMSEREPDDRSKVRAMVALGRCVLVESHERFCRITDASMGEAIRFVEHCATLAEAESALDGLLALDPDGSFRIEGAPVADITDCRTVHTSADDILF